MKRFHVHVSVDDLVQSVRFYSTLFSAEPTVLKDFTHGTATVYGQSGALTKLGEASGGLSTCGCAPAALTGPAAEPVAAEACCAPSCCAA